MLISLSFDHTNTTGQVGSALLFREWSLGIGEAGTVMFVVALNKADPICTVCESKQGDET